MAETFKTGQHSPIRLQFFLKPAMYSQPLFSVEDPCELARWMRAYPLATVVAVTPTGLEANLLPLEVVHMVAAGEHRGRVQLKGHVARSHALSQVGPTGVQVLVVFQSPNAYISPRWYVNGQRSGRLAPSWNYVAVEARGRMRLVDDGAWLRRHLAALTLAQEAHRNAPWSLTDASPEFVDEAAARLIGLEIDVEQLAGKRFLSQQRTEADRRSLVEHLAEESTGAARDVAGLITP